jgi:arylsulfatase A
VGLAEQTLILFTSDNGTNKSRRSALNGRVIRGGKGTPTDAGTRVPLVAYGPGIVTGGRVSEDLVDLSDFLPTLLDAAGVTAPDGLDGRSFLPQLRGERGSPREWIYCYYCPRPEKTPPIRFVRDRRWKLYGDGRLFDVLNDPGEAHPFADAVNDADAATAGATRAVAAGLTEEAAAARRKLAAALASMPGEGRTLLRFTP